MDIAVGHAGSPFISAYPVVDGVLGAKYSNPSSLPVSTCEGLAFSSTGDDIVIACVSSPYIYAYSWVRGNGFSAKYSNPATLPTGAGNCIAFSNDDDVAIGMDGSPYIYVYPWVNSTGFGVKYSDPAVTPSTKVEGVAFYGAVDIALASPSFNTHAYVMRWVNGSGFSTKYNNPLDAADGYPEDVDFHPDGTDIAMSQIDGGYNLLKAWPFVPGSGLGTKYTNASGQTGHVNGYSCKFSGTGLEIALSHNSGITNYCPVTCYNFTSGSGFGSAVRPVSDPNSNGYEVCWIDDDYVFVADDEANYIKSYSWDRSGQTLTLLDFPPSPPAGAAGGVGLTEEGEDPAAETCPMPVFLKMTPYIPMDLYERYAGKTTGESNGKLIDTNAAFSTWGIEAGDLVENRANGNGAFVVSVDSETQLTLSDHVFVTGNYYKINKLYDTLEYVWDASWEERAFSAEAEIKCDNGEGTYDSYDAKGMMLRIRRGYYDSAGDPYPFNNCQWMRVVDDYYNSWPREPDSPLPQDEYVLEAKGLWEILANWKLPVDIWFNEAGWNDNSDYDDMTAYEIVEHILLEAGLELGDDIDDMSSEYIYTLKPKKYFAAGTTGVYIVIYMLSKYQCNLLARQDYFQFLLDDNGKSYEYRCPTDASYQSLLGGSLYRKLPDLLKCEVYSDDAVYVDGAWSATYSGSYADSDWQPYMGKTVWVDTEGIVTSNAIAAHIAQARVERATSGVETGVIYLEIMDVCQELYTETTAVDGRGQISDVGLTGSLRFRYRPNHEIYDQWITLGGIRPKIGGDLSNYLNDIALGTGAGIPSDSVIGLDTKLQSSGLAWALRLGG